MGEIKGIYAASLSILDQNLALNIDKTIHIQAEINTNLSLQETRWLQSLADSHSLGFPNAIIGFVDLKDSNITFLLS